MYPPNINTPEQFAQYSNADNQLNPLVALNAINPAEEQNDLAADESFDLSDIEQAAAMPNSDADKKWDYISIGVFVLGVALVSYALHRAGKHNKELGAILGLFSFGWLLQGLDVKLTKNKIAQFT